MSKVLIGITCNYLKECASAFQAGIGAAEQDWQLIAQDYLNAVWRAGAVPILIPIDENVDRALEMLDMVNGLLLSGGNDVSPELYGSKENKCGTLDANRDRMEMALLKAALEKRMPILGICRGIQLMNSVLGGTLHQDLPSEGFPNHTIVDYARTTATHTVDVKDNSLLASIVGSGELVVNSFHHQSVDRLAEGLETAASSKEGIIEAAYMPDYPFALAVQWHPEMMFDSDVQQKIFAAFVKACQ